MRFSVAIGVSIALHGVLVAGLAAYVKYASRPTTFATLDLSSVDLSFAEEEDETAVAALSKPALPPAEPPTPREERPPEPTIERPDDPLPPDPAAPCLPKPEPDREPMATPEIPKEETMSPEPPPTAAPKQARVDAPPRPRKAIRPDYPKGARQRGEQGDVVVELAVTADGMVSRVEIVSSCGFPELDESAVRAAKAARFTPAKSGQNAVASTARLTLTFRLK